MDYLHTIGVPYFDILEWGYDIVIAAASVQFLAVIYFDEVLEVCARICEIGNSSIKMDYETYEAESGRFAAKT